jgi:molecular chaperone GrpE
MKSFIFKTIGQLFHRIKDYWTLDSLNLNQPNETQNITASNLQPPELPKIAEEEQEPVPQGLPAEMLAEMDRKTNEELLQPDSHTPDLYTLLSAMTTLSQEVKLQGRAFRGLEEKLSGVAEIPGVVQKTLDENEKSLQAATTLAEENRTLLQKRIDEARESAREDLLDLLLDLRDRLVRGRSAALAHLKQIDSVKPAGWFRRWRKPSSPSGLREATLALEKGYSLSIDRLEESLREFGITEFNCSGKTFDPVMMKAVDIEDREDVPAGTVLEVYRPGYERNGQMYRLPEVKVSRNNKI